MILCGNQIRHCLCLTQINSSVQKCPLRELSRLRRTRAVSAYRLQNLSCDENSTMTVDLHRILCGVAARCFHKQQQHFIDPLSPLFDISIMNGMAFRLMKILLFAGWRHKNCLSSLQCLRSTNADHTDSSRACRCRNRCDRIFHSSPPKYRQLLPLKILFDIQQNPLDHSQRTLLEIKIATVRFTRYTFSL